LLATDTQPNGGWWFYKWYGDMGGDMVATLPAAANEVTTLDGFANLDVTAQSASVLFAGVNDGTVRVVIEGFSAAPFFGGTVHTVVERTPWVSRSTVVTSTEVLSTADVPISGNQIELTVPGANDFDGYRVTLTPTGGGGAGGADCAGSAEDAYLGTPSGVPGTVEAENFDPGAYHDTSTGNEGGAYRPTEDVDLKAQGDGFVVGWMTAGEWLEYTVNVAAEGDYELTLTGGAIDVGRTVSLGLCGAPLATLDVPVIGAWGDGLVTTAPAVVHLPAGLQVIRLTVGDQDYLDLDSLTFALVEGAGGAGGTAGNGGTSSGGAGGTAGVSGAAGASGSGGGIVGGGTGGATAAGGAAGGGVPGGTGAAEGCGCRAAGRPSLSPSLLALALAGLLGLKRRKRPRA